VVDFNIKPVVLKAVIGQAKAAIVNLYPAMLTNILACVAYRDCGWLPSEQRVNTNFKSEVKWIKRVRQTRTIFSSLSDEESRRKRQRFSARSAIEQFVAQAEPFMSGVVVDLEDLDSDIKFPAGTFAEWSALFQNAFANATNAMIDKRVRKVGVSSGQTGQRTFILVQDTGIGVDLAQAEKLFEPFERKTVISKERKSLSIGGSGLGLTIIRLIARNLGFNVSFVKPTRDYATCLKIEWQESGR
jgi:C4-dicarboxylate-specific signal transduction histidine kinase